MEREFIAQLQKTLASPLGISDDAALVELAPRGDVVVTTDLLADGTHFRLEEHAPSAVGRKALAVNLSDLAAMAAEPVAAFVSLLLPRENARSLADELMAGIIDLARQYDVEIAGGDTNCWNGKLVINVAALGRPTERGLLLRSGAKPGDAILVTGALGGSILGKHLHFEPRVREALLLAERYELHAGMDISDGLALDLSRLIEASGCGAVIDLDRVPIAPAAEELTAREAQGGAKAKSPLEHALSDGEDFELLLTAAPEEAERMAREQPPAIPIAIVGEIVAESGLWSRDANGNLTPLTPQGYEHA